MKSSMCTTAFSPNSMPKLTRRRVDLAGHVKNWIMSHGASKITVEFPFPRFHPGQSLTLLLGSVVVIGVLIFILLILIVKLKT